MTSDYKKPKKIASIVSAVSEVLSVSNVPQQLLDMTLDTLLEVMKIDCCWIQRLSSKSHKLRLAAYRGFTSAMNREISSMDLGQKFGNQVAGLGHRIIIPDLSRDNEYGLASFGEAGFRSLVAVPLRTYRVQGVIGIASQRKRRFNAETTELLTIIAGLVGMALDKADLYQRILTNEKELSAAARLSVISSSGMGDIHTDLVTELKEAAAEWTMATDKAEKAAEQIAKLSVPSHVSSPGPHNSNTVVPEPRTVVPESPTVVSESHTVVTGKVRRADKIRTFIVDRQVIFRHVLCACLSQTDDIEVIGESGDFVIDTATMLREIAPNVVLVDANLPSLSGVGLARRIAQNSHNISVILLAPYENGELVLEALRAGVAGYLSKDITGERLASAIRRVSVGERIIEELFVRPRIAQWVLTTLQRMEKSSIDEPLIPDESQMVGYFANGYSPKQVAHIMGTSEQEIRNRMASIAAKLVPSGYTT